MESTIAHLISDKKQYDYATIVNELENYLYNAVSGGVVDYTSHDIPGGVVGMITLEKFYFRTGSFTALSILYTEVEEKQWLDIVGYGGGEGLVNFSWGANSNFTKKITEFFLERGFREV